MATETGSVKWCIDQVLALLGPTGESCKASTIYERANAAGVNITRHQIDRSLDYLVEIGLVVMVRMPRTKTRWYSGIPDTSPARSATAGVP